MTGLFGEDVGPAPDGDPLARVPLARRKDPQTSHEAAREVKACGQVEREVRECVRLVTQYPDRTTADLAQFSTLDRFVIAKRMSVAESRDLIHKGPRVVSQTTGKGGVSWRPGRDPRKQQQGAA